MPSLSRLSRFGLGIAMTMAASNIGFAVLLAYVANPDSNPVSVIDAATNTVIGTPIPVGHGTIGIAIT